MSADEDEILGGVFDFDGLNPLESEGLDHVSELIFLEVADAEGDVVLLHEHLVALEDVALPEMLLELRKGVKYLEHEVFLDLQDLGHCVGGGFGVVYVGHQALEAEDMAHKHVLLIGEALVGKLHGAAALFYDEEVLGDLRVVHDALVGVERVLLSNLIGDEPEDGVRDHLEEFALPEREVEVGFLPLGRGEVKLKGLSIDYVIEQIVLVGLQLSVLVVFVDDV